MTCWLRPLAPLFVVICAAGLFADDANKKNSEIKTEVYYPLEVGTTWHYKIGEKKATAVFAKSY